jgi:hypothetical protein
LGTAEQAAPKGWSIVEADMLGLDDMLGSELVVLGAELAGAAPEVVLDPPQAANEMGMIKTAARAAMR